MDSMMIKVWRHTKYYPFFNKVAVTYRIIESKHNELERLFLLQITTDAIEIAYGFGGILISPDQVPEEECESSYFEVLFQNMDKCKEFLNAIGEGSSY